DKSETDEHAQEQVASPVSTIEKSVGSLTGRIINNEAEPTPVQPVSSEKKYVKELLKIFNMEVDKEIDTPIATATKLDLDEIGPSIELRNRLLIYLPKL
ncbi:hypothetical protein HAX54_011026, partial [Datura stramonium]|nr:hypothetical protein [Datura stramonium]